MLRQDFVHRPALGFYGPAAVRGGVQAKIETVWHEREDLAHSAISDDSPDASAFVAAGSVRLKMELADFSGLDRDDLTDRKRPLGA